jgi:hypothetical protein
MNTPLRFLSSSGLLVRLLICVAVAAAFLYAYLQEQNELTRTRLAIPVLLKEIREIEESTVALQYQIEQFESPDNLMALAARVEYAHLKQPLLREIIALAEMPVVEEGSQLAPVSPSRGVALALGTAR